MAKLRYAIWWRNFKLIEVGKKVNNPIRKVKIFFVFSKLYFKKFISITRDINKEETEVSLFTKKSSASKIFCCVYGCKSTPHKDPNLSFHYFPKKNQNKVNNVSKIGIDEIIDRRML